MYDGDADDTSEPLPGATNSKIIPGRSANVTTPAGSVVALIVKTPDIEALRFARTDRVTPEPIMTRHCGLSGIRWLQSLAGFF
ncbi:hypothetical protein [Streptomyces sp. NEAU-W12]|uniref:hypothetical protein n=1 Tax=Streptomyces sp. NEAU-W12 TaxID=2994668 RepID=UPI00224A84BD|nr:hypothetical protein [Streptomyces sp. NEAU-W12]MCX2927895.1 hypothetical protein [Streptomyces sp. NEAU-W12]